MPNVTVIIPLYNKARYILRALNSVAQQKYQDFEVIVVNDGSTDNSAEVVASFRDPRFRVVHQKNAGPGAARNHGIAEAQAPLIAFLDADDEWFPDHLETAVRIFQETPGLGCLTQGHIDEPGAFPSGPRFQDYGFQEGIQQLEGQTALMLHYMIAYMESQATVVRTDVIRKWGGFYENRCIYGEDSFLWLKVLLNEQVAYTLRETMAIHREASDLNLRMRHNKPRPIEPFLADPEALIKVCPPNLLPLLRDFFTLRAFKTACAWGYVGQWQRAAEIRRQFRQPGDSRIPWYYLSWIFSTPIGAGLGAASRAVNSLRKGPIGQGASAIGRAAKPNRVTAANS